MRYAIGMDVGGSSARVALVREDGEISHSASLPTGFDTPRETVLARFRELLRETMQAVQGTAIEVEGVGIGMPGLQDAEGRVDSASNLPELNGADLRAEAAGITGVPAFMENDLNVVALGEYHFGGHRTSGNLLVVALGTGIGAAVIQNGRILRVARGCLGDPGHVLVEPGGRLCHCGARGCLEAHVAGWALIEQARHLGLRPANGAELRPRDLFAASRGGHAGARALVRHAAHMLAMGLASFGALYQPRRIVLGGNVLDEAQDLLVPPAAEFFESIVQPWLRGLLDPPHLSRIPQTAGVLGGAALVLFHNQPGEAK